MAKRAYAWTLAAAVGLLVIPATASAVTYCVGSPGCAGTAEPDLQTALNAASATTTVADIVRVGNPGAPPAGGYAYADGALPANRVDIVGAGRAQTALTGTGPNGTVLFLGATTSTVSHLSIRIPAGLWTGVQTSGTVRDVDVSTLDDGSGTQTGGVFLTSPGAAPGWFGGSVVLAAGAGSQTGFLATAPGLSAVVEDVAITADDQGVQASNGTFALRRVSVRSPQGYVGTGESATIEDFAVRPPASSGFAVGLLVSSSPSTDGSADVDHLSADGNRAGVSYGVLVSSGSSGRSAAVTVRNSIVRNYVNEVFSTANGASTAANATVSYSDVDLLHSQTQNAGGGTGAITAGAGVIDENPHWIDSLSGNFGVPASSPVVDAGQPGPVGAGRSTTDLTGHPRIANGRTDMGAIEFQQPPVLPPPPPALTDTTAPMVRITGLKSKLTLKQLLKGASFKVTPSEAASLDVTLTGAASRATLARTFNLVLAHKAFAVAAGARKVKLKPSRKLLGRARKFKLRVTIVATDRAGNARKITRTVAIKR